MRKILAVLIGICILCGTLLAAPIMADAVEAYEAYTWGPNIATQSDLSVKDYAEHLLDATLYAEDFYLLDFDLCVGKIATSNLTVLLDETERGGQYLSFWFSEGQIRFGSDSNGIGFPDGDATIGNFVFSENQTYHIKILIQNDSLIYYINGTVVSVIYGANYAYQSKDYSPMTRQDGAKIGFVGQNTNPDILIKNVTLKQRQWEEQNNLLARTSLNLEGNVQYADVQLNPYKSYRLSFNATLSDDSPLYIVLREGEKPYYGQCVALWTNFNQVRVATDMWGLEMLGVGNPDPALTNGSSVSVSILSEPEAVTVSIDGQVIAMYDDVAKTFNNTKISVPAVGFAKLGFAAGGSTPTGKLSKMSLTELNGSVSTYRCNRYYGVRTVDIAGPNYWPNNVLVDDAEDGKGVHFTWKNAGTNFRQLINRPLSMNGMHLCFSDLSVSGTYQNMAIFLAELYNGSGDWDALYSEYVAGSPTILMLLFDFRNGRLSAQVEGQPPVVLIQSDRLKAQNLASKDWDLKIAGFGSDFRVTVAGEEGVLPGALVQSATRLNDLNKVYATLSPWGSSCNMQFNLRSAHGNDSVCCDDLSDSVLQKIDNVIAKIDAVFTADGQIVPESESCLAAAETGYNALGAELKKMIFNNDKMTVAQTVLPVVKQIAAIGPINLESGGVLDAVTASYRSLSPQNRRLVGNFDEFTAAKQLLYRLQRFEKIGYDINGDGLQDANDLLTLKGVLLNVLHYASGVADVNSDGTVDVRDLVHMKKNMVKG